MVPVTPLGEIVSVQEAMQFQPNKSQFMCGFFSCAMARSMAPVGKVPTLTMAQVIQDAMAWYREYDGTDAITNINGMTTEQLYSLLKEIGLHFQATQTDVNTICQWLATGYPVIAAVMEASVIDSGLQGKNPYPWTPAGSHVILITGASASKSYYLVRDSANCTSLTDPNSLRPGPRMYTSSKLQVISATVAVPPWMPRPTSNVPPKSAPAQADPNLHLPGPDWTDDGQTLWGPAPNKQPVVQGNRTYVLTHPWDPKDVPLAPEEGADPVEMGYQQPDGQNKGTRQLFAYSELCWTPGRGVYRATVGRELQIALQAQKKGTSPT